MTPLMWAASWGALQTRWPETLFSEDTIRVLLKYGADPGLRDWQGRTALDYATSGKNRRLALALTDFSEAGGSSTAAAQHGLDPTAFAN